MAVLAIGCIVCAIGGAVIATVKNRSPLGWGLLCLVIGIVGVIIVAVMPKIEESEPVMPWISQMKATATPASPVAAPAPSAPSVTSDLQQLSSMHARGALSAEEFAAAIARVLDGSVSMAAPEPTPTSGAVVEDSYSVICSCGTKNRRNRTRCWTCNEPLPVGFR